MYLLSTARAELRFFRTVEEAQYEGYAILSHVWNEKEQTFAETNTIARECGATGANPRDHSFDKVRESCLIAERYGHKWIWNDACCIDKGSSSELSEAINSMFTWYARAEVCYVYLQDVPSSCRLDLAASSQRPDSQSEFELSKWFTRGWTLQELLAPTQVVFLSQDWEVIGTKAHLAALLEKITMIPRAVLTLDKDIRDISVASRMSWSTGRATTRPEDEAYCLMGIFDINMPTLYGEGRKAFQRLQEEIMRKTADTTLFAWSELVFDLRAVDLIRPEDPLGADGVTYDKSCLFLLASKPGDFRASSNVEFAPNAMQILCNVTEDTKPTANVVAPLAGPSTQRPTFTITPFGIDAHLPVVKIRNLTVAVLFASREGEQLGLFLSALRSDSTPPLYYPCVCTKAGMWPARLAALSSILREAPEYRRQLLAAPWLDICFAHTPPSLIILRPLPTTILFPEHATRPGPYYIPPRFLISGRPPVWLEPLPPPPGYSSPNGDAPPIAFALGRDVEVFLGLCTAGAGAEGAGTTSHWVNVRRPGRGRYELDGPPTHECSRHHIEEWAEWKKGFEIEADRHVVRITFAFIPSPVNPTTTCMLTGLDYERIVRAQSTSPYSPYVLRQVGRRRVKPTWWYNK
ncbi:HET-domain-containing protein [Polyporus arcularius HHB13444]|uniref:HET-domain-containing protein n=1 Tax=Polyporus arcularius HHB13444 TaxID=1314778 RepID=A0A5C3PNV9_9APHY|nr:HET-domain-containing protein [Polyporus arcularius HHB13444]